MNPRPRLVPELVVSDRGRSLAFWRGPIGFGKPYDRPEDGFASLGLDVDREVGQRQFVVADPYGYLCRPARDLGSRPL